MPGAGTAGGVICGAVSVLDEVFEFKAFAGTSFGGLAALFLANGGTPAALIQLSSEILQRNDLLDKGWPWDQNKPGIFRGLVIEKLIKGVFGEKRKMGDLKFPARVGVVALNVGRSGMVCSKRPAHKELLVWRVARATMAIEFFFDPIRLREDNARVYGDGGLGLNVPSGAWDDREEPTVALRFAHHQRHTLEDLLAAADGDGFYKDYEHVRTYGELVPAAFNVSMAAAAASFPSVKPPSHLLDVVLESDADGMKFGLSAVECAVRVQQGSLSARRALLKLKTV